MYMYIYALVYLLHVYFSHTLSFPPFSFPSFSLSLSQELSSLYQLTSLQCLSLCDPLYPPSSLCRLCNYSTLILYHMPWLKWLDSRDVDSVELRDLIKVRRRVEERERERKIWCLCICTCAYRSVYSSCMHFV